MSAEAAEEVAQKTEDVAEKTLPKYSLEEVAKHDSIESLWLVVHDKVYDVTQFVEEHPGGEEVLLEVAGTVATDSFEDVGHSEDARVLQAKYLIGELSCPIEKKVNRKTSPTTNSEQVGSSMSYITPMLVMLVVAIGLAIYLNYS